MIRKLRVGVIFGGRSGEHQVSLASARSVIDALDRDGFDVVPLGITQSGRWLLTGNPMATLLHDSASHTGDAAAADGAGTGRSEGGNAAEAPVTRELVPGATGTALPPLDVVFPVLHGPFGEDGTLQGLLELADVAYVGAGVVGSSVGMDKGVFKDVMRANGIPIIESMVILRTDVEKDINAVIDRIER